VSNDTKEPLTEEELHAAAVAISTTAANHQWRAKNIPVDDLGLCEVFGRPLQEPDEFIILSPRGVACWLGPDLDENGERQQELVTPTEQSGRELKITIMGWLTRPRTNDNHTIN